MDRALLAVLAFGSWALALAVYLGLSDIANNVGYIN